MWSLDLEISWPELGSPAQTLLRVLPRWFPPGTLAVPAWYPRSPWINDLFPPGGEASPQRELRGSTFSAELSQLEAEGGQRWRGSGLSHLSAARIPTHVARTPAAESVSVVLGEKLWRERKGGCRDLPLGRPGELVLPAPAPVLSDN